MAALSPPAQNELLRDIRAVDAAMRSGVSRGRHSTAAAYENRWTTYSQQHDLETVFRNGGNPVPWIQIFAERVRSGRLSASGNRVRSGTVADAVNFVAQTFTLVGQRDPRHYPGTTTIDLRLARQLKGYGKSDPNPQRVKPIPMSVLRDATAAALSNPDDHQTLAAVDMMWIAFFFLLRPGEYTRPAEDSHPFRIEDVQLWIDITPVNIHECPASDFLHCTFVALTFSTQKNGTRGEAIGHGRSGDAFACPVLAVARRLRYLRSLNAPPSTYICAVGPQFIPLIPAVITSLLRQAVSNSNIPTGIVPTDITAKSLRATGAMSLINQGIDASEIHLIGRWKSDAMLRYLHVQAHNIMQGYSARMLQGGQFNLIPTSQNSILPSFL